MQCVVGVRKRVEEFAGLGPSLILGLSLLIRPRDLRVEQAQDDCVRIRYGIFLLTERLTPRLSQGLGRR
eukprot:scaffold790_cov387-Prasinococcus_capsulatus_cf.AAC.11